MKYYNVTSTRNGEPWVMVGHDVSEQSLAGLREVFKQDGVELHATWYRTIPDRPVWTKNEETGKLYLTDEDYR